MFQLGDKVQWESQSQGYATAKQGEIVGIVPPNNPVSVYILARYITGYRWGFYSVQFDCGARGEESYLVAVPSKTGKAKTKLYWPRVAGLKKVEAE